MLFSHKSTLKKKNTQHELTIKKNYPWHCVVHQYVQLHFSIKFCSGVVCFSWSSTVCDLNFTRVKKSALSFNQFNAFTRSFLFIWCNSRITINQLELILKLKSKKQFWNYEGLYGKENFAKNEMKLGSKQQSTRILTEILQNCSSPNLLFGPLSLQFGCNTFTVTL